MVLCTSHWPQTPYLVEGDLELLILCACLVLFETVSFYVAQTAVELLNHLTLPSG